MAMHDDLLTAVRHISSLMPQRIQRLWCTHPKVYVPVYPIIGPAPWKVCECCGTRQPVEVAEYGSLELRRIGAEVVDMTGNLGR